MLEIRELADGGYVIRNMATNHLLTNRHGELLVFKKAKKAAKHINRLNKLLSKTLARLQSDPKGYLL